MKKFDIFISYRRDGGFEVADSMYQRLIAAGYAAFLDIEQLNSGTFNTKLLEVIDGCKDFILILPPHALDRCNDENDWVRKEVEHAIKGGKNIIPIMLRGFEWPSDESLPESLRGLSNYNGITASDHNIYVENVERLKNKFLTSHPTPWWKRHKVALIIVLTLLLSALTAGILLNNKESNEDSIPKEYTLICEDYTTQMMREYIKMDANLVYAERAKEAWNDFLIDYKRGGKDKHTLGRLTQEIEIIKGDLLKPDEITLSDNDIATLRKHYPKYREFSVLEMMYDAYYEEVNNFLSTILRFANDPHPTQYESYIKTSYDSLAESLNMNYLYILGICSMMPDSTDNIIFEHTKALSNNVSTTAGLEFEAYDSLMEVSLNKQEEYLRQLTIRVNESSRNESVLDEISAEIERVETRLEGVSEACMESWDAEINEKDDITSAWTKIHTVVTTALDCNALLYQLNELYTAFFDEADKARIDFGATKDDLFDYKTLREGLVDNSFKKVCLLLNQYELHNPNKDTYISEYVKAAQVFYAGIASGVLKNKGGLLVFATLNDMEHPAFKVGDVIIEMADKKITTTNDFITARGAKDTDCKAKVLRMNNKGYMDVIETTIPANCSITIDAVPLI